jgi:hypothetical protein
VFMFKVLILQTSHSLSDDRTEILHTNEMTFIRHSRLQSLRAHSASSMSLYRCVTMVRPQ